MLENLGRANTTIRSVPPLRFCTTPFDNLLANVIALIIRPSCSVLILRVLCSDYGSEWVQLYTTTSTRPCLCELSRLAYVEAIVSVQRVHV